VIPQRVTLQGFLCYKERQSIEFDGNATLWMLSGLNGSGKSAIFDAVTYALFGHHRGGGTGAVELINKDSDTMLVEFDFLLDAKVYRAKRSLKRDNRGGARGTQQIFRYESATEGKGSWSAVEDTGQKREFDRWISDTIGLNYDTFTSSVLLLQGKAEKLLDSKPEGRREVLASIVDLERYERLHKQSDDGRKSLEAELKVLNGRLASIRDVTPIEMEEAKGKITEAEEARERSRAEVDRLVALEMQVRWWADFQQRLAAARQRFRRAEAVLLEAPHIEANLTRLTELRLVVPHLQEITIARAGIHESEARTRTLEDQREKMVKQIAGRENSLKQVRERRATFSSLISQDDAELREVSRKLQVCAVQVERLKEYERQEADVARLRVDLERMPGDVPGQVKKARDRFEELNELSRTVPLLTRFQTHRDDLRRAREQETQAVESRTEVRGRGEKCKLEMEGLKKNLDEAAQQSQKARDRAAEARTLHNQARQSLEELSQLDGSSRCRHCGQALTPGHLRDEKGRRSREATETRTRFDEATREQQDAERVESDLRTQFTAAQDAYQKARSDYIEVNEKVKNLQERLSRLLEECGQGYAELPESFRVRVSPDTPADWLTTRYPSVEDLQSLKGEVGGLEPARQALRKAEKLHQDWNGLKAREGLAQENLTRLVRELPANREGVRQEHADLQSREKALHGTIDANKKELQKAERELDTLTRERDRDQAALNKLEAGLTDERLKRDSANRSITSHTKQLPETWQSMAERTTLRELSELSGEQKRLEAEGTDDHAKELQHARMNLDVLRQEQEKLELEASKVPDEARVEPAVLTTRLAETRQTDLLCEEALREVREHKAVLEEYVKQRRQLQEEIRKTEIEWRSSELLAELLGRNRLQLYLVRQAERQVVEYANAVLDRLSGGHLYLKLSGEANGEGASAKALELEAYNRNTGEKPINVAFLSGSQKFRVAVSLALGIGQYASRQHRPIESVIIDEGFGCLDSQGRQVMVQELQNLRSQMRCILLVSHQEDFAEAFTDGYTFQLENGATRVQRFHK
jgi:DNA repair exonuclease SbcCD ATPase subunit